MMMRIGNAVGTWIWNEDQRRRGLREGKGALLCRSDRVKEEVRRV